MRTPPLSERDKDIVWLFANKIGKKKAIEYFAKYYGKHIESIRDILGE